MESVEEYFYLFSLRISGKLLSKTQIGLFTDAPMRQQVAYVSPEKYRWYKRWDIRPAAATLKPRHSLLLSQIWHLVVSVEYLALDDIWCPEEFLSVIRARIYSRKRREYVTNFENVALIYGTLYGNMQDLPTHSRHWGFTLRVLQIKFLLEYCLLCTRNLWSINARRRHRI